MANTPTSTARISLSCISFLWINIHLSSNPLLLTDKTRHRHRNRRFDMSESSNLEKSSSRSSAGRNSPMSTIESSVTRLLVSTKHLLESLTQWARQEADDKFVSDAYVKLGNDFRAAVRAFTIAGVDISDLGDVPRALRIVLESALSEAPTQENLDRFLPNIRNIIVNLLSSLKAKQSKAKELAISNSISAQNPDQSITSPSRLQLSDAEKEIRTPPRSGPRRSRLLSEQQLKQQASDDVGTNSHQSLRKTNSYSDSNANSNLSPNFHLSPGSSDALSKLQKGNVISRRASKRFSAYQFAKLANLNNSQIPRVSSELIVPSESPEINGSSESEHLPGDKQKETTSSFIFMRIEDSTKKVEVELPLSMASVRLLFVEKFAYSPRGTSFPDIYLLDTSNNVSFELEEHKIETEVKNGSLIFLKLSDTKDNALKTLETKIENMTSKLDESLSNIASQVQEALESSKMTVSPIAPVPTERPTPAKSMNSSFAKALINLQQEVKAIKQISDVRNKSTKSSAEEIMREVLSLKEACLKESSPTSNRSFMEESYSKLSEDSDSLLTRVDDLQDMMEDLRKDVAQRGVRLGPKQLKLTHNEIEEVRSLLSNLTEYINDGKSTWKKIWEAELDKVCEEQQFFNLQDDLTRDLDDDIKKIEETFELIERCSVEQGKKSQKRNIFAPRIMLPEPGETIHDLRDAVLNEVAALVPNHEERLDAIAKAEKLRERERQHPELNQFQEELGDFVDEGRLKKSGGIEELEKRRQQQDLENLKSSMRPV